MATVSPAHFHFYLRHISYVYLPVAPTALHLGVSMARDLDQTADLLAKHMQAFDLVVIQKKSLREAALVVGVSHTTVRDYVRAYKQAIASDRVTEDVEERRASFDAELEMLKAKALEVYNYSMNSGRTDELGRAIKQPLAAIGALNSYTATLTHQRAVQGLDTPKAVEAKQDVTYTVKWEE